LKLDGYGEEKEQKRKDVSEKLELSAEA